MGRMGRQGDDRAGRQNGDEASQSGLSARGDCWGWSGGPNHGYLYGSGQFKPAGYSGIVPGGQLSTTSLVKTTPALCRAF